MKIQETPLSGVRLITPHTHEDSRGGFIRLMDRVAFENSQLSSSFAQTAISSNKQAYTLRGMHLQRPPAAESKMIYCLRGRLYDVVVDLRKDSPTFCRWFGVELNSKRPQMLYIPEGCAHGFLTLEPDTEILYHISIPRSPEDEIGFAWDDPAFVIKWPAQPAVISERDRGHPQFNAKKHAVVLE